MGVSIHGVSCALRILVVVARPLKPARLAVVPSQVAPRATSPAPHLHEPTEVKCMVAGERG